MKKSYKIIKKIGQGEHGSIFLVSTTTGKDTHLYAMKKVAYNVYKNTNQFQLLPKLCHPNIIRVLEKEQNEMGYTLFQQYAQQGDMHMHAHRKYQGIVPQPILMRWLCQIALALHYLHSQVRVLHRDVKSKNILVMKNGLVKLADFGTSRQLSKNEQFAMTAVGTPYYLSPQAVGSSKYNSKSDVWGLGCILFELSTGKKPFQANSLNDLIKRILNDDIQQISNDYTPQFRQLVKSMLQKNFDKRITIQSILQRNQVRQAFFQIKQEYEKQYKDFMHPIKMDIKTKKYCQRQQILKTGFTTQSMKTVKNLQKQKSLKLQVIECWGRQPKSSKFPMRNTKKQEQKVVRTSKKIEHTKYLDRSLKSLIDKKNNQKANS